MQNKIETDVNQSGENRPTLLSSRELACKNVSYSKVFFENLVWLTSEEARIYLRLSSKEALRQLVYRGVLVQPYRIGRSIRFKKSELDTFIESSRLQKRRRF